MAAGGINCAVNVIVGVLSAADVIVDERAGGLEITVAATTGPPIAVTVLPGAARWSV